MIGRFHSKQQVSMRLMRLLFIQVKDTPNPNFMKFVPTGKQVMSSGTHDFTAARFSYGSPLAKRLFAIDGITRVFYGKDYISIGKHEDSDWAALKPQVYEKIEHFFDSGEALFSEGGLPKDTEVHEDDSESVAFIKEILETRIRPTVQEDGGDIEFLGFDEASGVVSLAMKGSCTNCPSSSVTLKNGIERMLTYYVAEVKSVKSVDYVQE